MIKVWYSFVKNWWSKCTSVNFYVSRGSATRFLLRGFVIRMSICDFENQKIEFYFEVFKR